MIQQLGLAAATGAHTHVCHWNSTSLRDIEPIVELVRNAQKQGLPVTTEAYVYGAGESAIGAPEFNPYDAKERMGVSFKDLSLVKPNRPFESHEEYVKAYEETPSEPAVVHFLYEDDDPADAALLDMAVMYPGVCICTDALPWANPDGSFYYGHEWPLPKELKNHPRAAGGYCRFLKKWSANVES